MKIVFSRRIVRKELWSKPAKSDLAIIRKWCEKWISETIKWESLPHGTKLIKIYATTVGGARRIVHLVDMESGDAFFLFFRKKNDSIGENITIKNPEFKKKLKEYLNILSEDLNDNNFDVTEVV